MKSTVLSLTVSARVQAASECEDAFAPAWAEGLQPALLAGVHPVFPFELCLLGFRVGGPPGKWKKSILGRSISGGASQPWFRRFRLLVCNVGITLPSEVCLACGASSVPGLLSTVPGLPDTGC